MPKSAADAPELPWGDLRVLRSDRRIDRQASAPPRRSSQNGSSSKFRLFLQTERGAARPSALPALGSCATSTLSPSGASFSFIGEFAA